MKKRLESALLSAFRSVVPDALDEAGGDAVRIERARNPEHGDYACNAAMVLGKRSGMVPRELAERVVEAFAGSRDIASLQVAGPGFINIKLAPHAWQGVVAEILRAAGGYGACDVGRGRRLHLEYVSANPTGPLHIGHGRGAAYGAAVANLLELTGYRAHREYYVNDAGRQMDILGLSVWLRFLASRGLPVPFPSKGYRGDYIGAIAASLPETVARPLQDASAAASGWAPEGDDAEAYLDRLIEHARGCLGDALFSALLDHGLNCILEGIRADLTHFGVRYDEWFSERSLKETGAVQSVVERLRAAGCTYEDGGALWFRSSDRGDEKDRVLVRDNGVPTYFAVDVAYHVHKLERRFQGLIDIWGADHHGYAPRIRAALEALGYPRECLDVALVQFATLYRGSERVQMSTRSGEFVTLRELCDEVGVDAARFFYVMRKSEQHLDFDLELAKSESQDNPVYYIQYAHARVCSIFKQLADRGYAWDQEAGVAALDRLDHARELKLLRMLSRYGEVIESAAVKREPHQVAHYLYELATDFHGYYGAEKIIVESEQTRNARLSLSAACRQVVANGLAVLGVSAPEAM